MPLPCDDRLLDDLVSLLKVICETPAPTFDETARGTLIRELLASGGLSPQTDEIGNVTAELPGGEGPRVLVAAHLDTVFDRGVDVTVRRQEDRLLAPGIGDNSASLAVLTHLVLHGLGETPWPRLTFAATVGEEGLGDLRGVRALLAARRQDFDAVVAIDGHLGMIIDRSVGSKRYSARFSARGGHSWGDYPSPSAVHALGEAIAALNKLRVPRDPRSSYNVCVVSGGTSVNAIAQEASLLLDLRSVDADVLQRLERQALQLMQQSAERMGATLSLERVGDRPADWVDNGALVAAARRALESLGLSVRTAASSTDANAAMAAGLPAITFGVYRGGDPHRLSEWLEPDSLLSGYQALRRLMAELSTLSL